MSLGVDEPNSGTPAPGNSYIKAKNDIAEEIYEELKFTLFGAMVKPVEGCCWANNENNIPGSDFFSPVSFVSDPPRPPPNTKPENGLGFSSDFFSSAKAFPGTAAAGVKLLLKEKPAKGLGLTSGFFSSWGFSAVPVVAMLLVKEKPPKTGLVSPADFGVPKTELEKPKDVEVTPAVADGVAFDIASDCPLV